MNTRNSNTDRQTTIPLSTASSVFPTGSHITPVYLNLYDLGGCNNTSIHSIGLSYYHCAIQTYSSEYGYMGHPYRFTGLYKTSKHDPRFHLYRLRQSIEISWTWFNEKELDQIVIELKPFYLGWDYHTTKKNSIHFAKDFLEQLSNHSQLKHLRTIQFPPYIDRVRRLSERLEFLQRFDTEKDIAEINILYFLYMKYQGNVKQICQLLQCDTIEKFKRIIDLIEQGIRQNKLPIFPSFAAIDMRRVYEYFYVTNEEKNSDVLSNNEQLTLTDIFHQFDTITLRGRTSIDRHLNIQKTKEIENEQRLSVERPQISDRTQTTNIPKENGQFSSPAPIFSHMYRSSQPQSISQNQGQTPMTSPSGSNISGLNNPSTIPIFTDRFFSSEHLHMRTAVPIGTVLRLQEPPKPDLSLISNRQRKLSSLSRKRKLPRDLKFTNELYRITNPNQ